MNTRKNRLEQAAWVLEQMDRRREATGDPTIGCGVERFLLEQELHEIEADILADPGALESQLVRVRVRRQA